MGWALQVPLANLKKFKNGSEQGGHPHLLHRW
jgi:hypothetical protein